MDQVQNMELSKDQIIQELIALLNQNQKKEAANDVFEMAALIDGMGKRLEQVTEELSEEARREERCCLLFPCSVRLPAPFPDSWLCRLVFLAG